MRRFQAEFITFAFLLSVALFFKADDFQIRLSRKISEGFSIEINDRLSQRSQKINFENQIHSKTESNYEEDEVEPKRIVFIKTHKTGSSTIQNIFYRYALGTIESLHFVFLAMDVKMVHIRVGDF